MPRFHRCLAPSCGSLVAPDRLCCTLHWRRLPAEIRRRIWANYRVNQQVSSTSSAYREAVRDAIDFFNREGEGTNV